MAIFQAWSAISVFAEWLLVDGNERARVYLDTETINRSGEWVRVWVVDDLKIAETRGFRKYLSTRAHEEHDCIKERFRLLALEYFSGNMGSGEALYKTSGESDWAPIPRGTLAESVWRFVCRGR
ncbi:MAG: surface-adhesin E family protein [Nitrospira sp.]